ncbi:MAG TPA: 2-dehydro-3-deoxyphosphogluconate aldolase, partial [Synechococcales bacterium UBA12195]|nr:2-dehydro-3-deoxyphosphogluconate aldolase [Synechococcales bacterium UBA12195]
LCDSLRQSPLLAVLRPGSPAQAQRQIDAVAAAGFHHVELAWSQEPWWLELLQTLPNHWPDLRFGVAGVRWAEQLVVAHGQGLRFAMSPISCP